jgi:hypothetical protein
VGETIAYTLSLSYTPRHLVFTRFGGAVVDFQSRQKVTRITLPPLLLAKAHHHEGGNISQGKSVSTDGKT